MELFKLLGTIVIDSAEAIKALKDAQQEGQQTESKLGKFFSGVGKGAVEVGKIVTKGMVAGAGAVTALGALAVKSYADYEQLVGGVETLFGTRGAKSVEEYAQLVGKSVKDVEAEFGMLQDAQSQVMQNAANAYKTCGLSANAYMETATSLAAALNQSSASQLDSANLADQAITDMSDNANKMGTSMELIQNAYNGFSKQNYTMLDNLKLGYGGTKEEMERLLADAGKLETAMGRKFDINNFADVTEAIHLMQVEMGISGISYKEYQNLVESGAMSEAEAFKLLGTTAKEANFTIAGSLGQLKGAWSNLLTGMADENANVGDLMNNLVESAAIALRNIIPRVTQALSGISSAITQIVPILEKEIPNLFQEALPTIIQAVVGLFDAVVGALPGIISAIQTILPQLIDGFMQIFTGVVEALIAALPMLIEGVMLLADGLIGALPQILQAIVTALPTLIPMLIDAFVGLILMLVEMLPQIIQPIIDALPTIIVSIVEALVQNLPALIQGFIQLFMGIVTALPQIIQALVDAIPTVVSLLVQAILNNLPAIIVGLIQCVMGIVVALPQILGSLISAVPAALAGIWDGIANVFSGLGAWFGEKFSGAKDAAVNAWSNAKEKFNTIKEKCSEAFSNFKDKVKEKFSAAKKNAEQAWSDAKEKWNGIKEKCVNGFSNLKDKVGTKFSEAKSKAVEKWNDAKTKFSSVKDKVVSAFSDLGGKLSPLFSKAKDNATKTWSNLKSIFNKFKNGDIVGAFSDLGSLLKGKFKGALNIAKKGFDGIKTIGKNLVQGLWNGINNAKDWVLGKIKGFGKGILNGLKSFFGIKSPSRVMRDQVGKMIAEGTAVGIEEGSKKVESASEKMGNAILKTAEKVLDEYKTYNNLTLTEEMNFWDEIRVQCEEGTDARLSADKKYLEAKKSLDDQLKTAEETLQKSLEETSKKVEERAKAIANTFDLFSSFKVDDYVDSYTMIRGLDSQISALEEYQTRMDELRSKIGDTALFKELESMGISALNKVEALTSMTDMQLQIYTNMFDERNALAHSIAKEELADETFAATQEAYQTFAKTCGELGVSVETATAGMQTSTATAFTAIAETVSTSTQSIADTIGDKMQNAVDSVNGAIAKIKKAFESFTAHMKMPHISVSGTFSVNPPSAPQFAVEWYKKAMNTPMLMNEPTIFGYNAASGNFMGGGEAGSEVVSGTNTLMNMIQNAVASQNDALVHYMQKIVEILAKYFPQLLEAFDVDVYLDSGVLVGEMAVPMNQALGILSSRKDRGR